MAPNDPPALTTDGSLNPAWLQFMGNKDKLMDEIAAYFLPGEKIKADVNCCASRCVMPNRTSQAISETSSQPEFNPMMLCYFCNRTFHAGCLDLDSHLIRDENLPWRCVDCKDLLSKFCQDYYNLTGYKTKLITRRAQFIQSTHLPEKLEDLKGDIRFALSDIQSFERRSLQIMAEEDPELVQDIVAVTPLLMKQVMRARADRKRAKESAERFKKELEDAQRQIRELNESTRRLASGDMTGVDNSTVNFTHFPPSSTLHVPSSGMEATNTLSSFYTNGNATMAPIEQNSFVYRPENIRQNSATLESTVNQSCNGHSGNATTNERQNDADISALISRLTLAQERTEDRHLLEARRKAIPKITEFNGDESKWLTFKQDVERYRLNCQFDDETVKLYIRGALKGDAYNIVRDIFDIATLDMIMSTLKNAYGDEMKMVRNRSEELRNFKFSSTLYKAEAVKLQATIQGYFAACNYAKTGFINTNLIAEAIFNQFNAEDRQRCKEFYRTRNPSVATIVLDVQTIYDYLMYRMPLLDDAPVKKRNVEGEQKSRSKPFQVHSLSVKPSSNQDFKFDIKDKIKAPYIGYDMTKVATIKKECELCNSLDHFTVQCRIYRDKSETERLKLILDKGLCKNCVLTSTHRAVNCDIKSGCGSKTDKMNRCSGKHHISVHNVANKSNLTSKDRKYLGKRRSHTKDNAANAKQRAVEALNTPGGSKETEPKSSVAVTYHAVDSTINKRQYNVLSVGNWFDNFENPKSVKVFKLKFWGPKGHVIAFAVGDSGSEITLMRDDLREALGIKGSPDIVKLQWADKTEKTCKAMQFDIEIQGVGQNDQKFSLRNCFALNDLNLPHRSLDMKMLRQKFPHLRNIPFEGYDNEQPVMLIGTTHAYLIEGCELVGGGSEDPVAVRTKLGWSVFGGMRNMNSGDSSVKNLNDTETAEIEQEDDRRHEQSDNKKISNDDLHKLLVDHCSIESLGIRPVENKLTEDEKKAVAILEEEIKVLANGFVEAPLVWNRRDKDIPQLPNNYTMVLQRQIALERKLHRNPEQLKAYNDNVKELVGLGFLREASEGDMKGQWKNVWYLPMSLVINENKTPPKMRNVFDASCVYKGACLNKNLLKGPDLLVNILQPLIRMRVNKIAFTADVKSMFNMVKICDRDQQCQRLLWRETSDAPMKTFIATVMLFGPTSSPFTSQYVKNMTAEKWKNKYPKAAETLINFTYMDDVLTSESNVEEAVAVATQCIEICGSINWQLTSFQSNSKELLDALPTSAVKKNTIPFPENEPDSHVTKVLGCYWNTVDDCFEFKLEKNIFIKLVKEFDLKPTKRDQASTLARIYDVSGLISHFTIQGKMLLQRSWANKIGWDETIDDKSAKEWKIWLQQINEVAKLKFPRRFTQLDALSEASEIQLHTFSDAGNEAFGAVAYLVTKSADKIESAIAMAKAKVTPLRLKTETVVKEIPRLELMAALLAARLSKTILNILKIDKIKKIFWSDSEVVLRWILNPNQKLLKYAIGPVEEILDTTERSEWRYVPTCLNVADLCTKMKRVDFSDCSIWMYGPEFIKLNEKYWPKLPEKLLIDDRLMVNNIYFEKFNYATHRLPPVNCPIANDGAIDRLRASIKTSWPKLARAVARTLRIYMDAFIPLISSKKFSVQGKHIILDEKAVKQMNRLTGGLEYLSPRDLERAEHFIFRKIQREAFPIEYKSLQNNKIIKNTMMLQLNVFMDPEGIMRINSRANLNDESFPQQFAPLLPRKSALVTALLAFYHEKYKHISTEAQIAEIRSKVWIPQLRTALRSIKAKCNWCNLKKAKPYSPQMAPLPTDRVNPELKPFEVTGIDVLGPLRPTVNGNVKKIYILIFVCTLTRYVHLHVLDSLESLRVLEAIVVFWTAYGPVRKFISDNGTNFKGAAKLLKEDYEQSQFFAKQQSLLAQKLSDIYRVEWQFIAVHAPWFGGMYERLIREVKRSLASTLDRRKINKIELNIAVQEAAHRINCRPLTENSIDATDGIILTPHHLAKNKSGWPLLPGIHKNVYTNVPDRSIYRRGRTVADEIMRKFTARYLPVLTRRSKWHKDEMPPRVGDLVLVIEPNKTRKEWKRAKVIKVHLGKDGIIRVADVEMANGVVKKNRAVRNLAKITINKDLNEGDKIEDAKIATVSTVFFNSNFASESFTANFTPINNLAKRCELKQKFNLLNLRGNKLNYIAIMDYDRLKVLQLDGVAPEMRLADVVEALEPEYKSVVGIAQLYDYASFIRGDTLFILLSDIAEYDYAYEKRNEINFRRRVRVHFPDLTLTSAYFTCDFRGMPDERLREVPKPFALFNLPQLSGSTTSYTAKILRTFESRAEITGFRWSLKDNKFETRNFGFVMTNSRETVSRLVGRTYDIGGLRIESRYATCTNVLIHERDLYLISNCQRPFMTSRMIQANWLNAKLPAVLAPQSRMELSVTVQNEHTSAIQAPIEQTQSSPRKTIEVADDAVVINLDPNETLDDDVGQDRAKVYKNLVPGTSTAEPTPLMVATSFPGTSANAPSTSTASSREEGDSGTSLKRRETDPLPKEVKKSKYDWGKESRYVRLTVYKPYPFALFLRRLGHRIPQHEVIVFRENEAYSEIFIEFVEIGDAKRFVHLIIALDDKEQSAVKFKEKEGRKVCNKGINRSISPANDKEMIYVIEKNKEIFKREYGDEWTRVYMNEAAKA